MDALIHIHYNFYPIFSIYVIIKKKGTCVISCYQFLLFLFYFHNIIIIIVIINKITAFHYYPIHAVWMRVRRERFGKGKRERAKEEKEVIEGERRRKCQERGRESSRERETFTGVRRPGRHPGAAMEMAELGRRLVARRLGGCTGYKVHRAASEQTARVAELTQK